MGKKILNRLQNKKVIIALTSGVLLILANWNLIDIEMSNKVEETVNGILTMLVLLGVIANPDSHLDKDK